VRNYETGVSDRVHEHEKPSRDETLIGPPVNYSAAAGEPLRSSLGARGLKLLANQAVRVGFMSCAKSLSVKRELRLQDEL
jgi:hypothetical protein